ncbi:MAG TPA: hypothetical protein VFX98_14415 [Longimicrobiaceae bacterium]|nr:hypothetical protein [Longimicrobiaceae bacterium]
MRRRLVIPMVLPLFALTPAGAAAQDPEPDERLAGVAATATVARVLALPRLYDGSAVSLRGVLRWHGDDLVLHAWAEDPTGVRLVRAAADTMTVREGAWVIAAGVFRAMPGGRQGGYLEAARLSPPEAITTGHRGGGGHPAAVLVDGRCASTGLRPPCACNGISPDLTPADIIAIRIVKGHRAARLGCADGVVVVTTRRRGRGER